MQVVRPIAEWSVSGLSPNETKSTHASQDSGPKIPLNERACLHMDNSPANLPRTSRSNQNIRLTDYIPIKNTRSLPEIEFPIFQYLCYSFLLFRLFYRVGFISHDHILFSSRSKCCAIVGIEIFGRGDSIPKLKSFIPNPSHLTQRHLQFIHQPLLQPSLQSRWFTQSRNQRRRIRNIIHRCGRLHG